MDLFSCVLVLRGKRKKLRLKNSHIIPFDIENLQRSGEFDHNRFVDFVDDGEQ